jgi:hypothetical protein
MDQHMTPAKRRSDAGFSLVEVLVALLLTLVVTGAAFTLVASGTTAAQTQPEVMDMQQRARLGSDLLSRDLFMAGAGVYAGPITGALSNFFAPIIPRRMGMVGADAYDVAKPDAVTIAYIPNSYSQTTIRDAMPLSSSELKVEDMANCPKLEELCGFKVGMTLLVFDDIGNYDFFNVTEIQSPAAHLQHRQQAYSNWQYQPGDIVTQAESHTYYYDAVNRQLRHYDGYETDVPVVENVVGVLIEYFGDPEPPLLPKPPLGLANCLYDAAGTPVGLPTLTGQGGSLATLPLSMLNDGPWCGHDDTRFDADLLRVRKVRITLRVQVGNDMMRGTSADFAVVGKSRSGERQLADYSVRFEITPRNMNLGR